MTPYQELQAELDLIRGRIRRDKDTGRVLDGIVGAKYKQTAAFVFRVRVKYGIACCPRGISPQKRAKIVNDPDTGVLPDWVMGERYDTTRDVIAGIRRREGIVRKYNGQNNRERALSKPNWRNELMLKWRL